MEKVHATEFLRKTGLGLTVLHCNASIQQTSQCNRLQSLPLLVLIGPSESIIACCGLIQLPSVLFSRSTYLLHNR